MKSTQHQNKTPAALPDLKDGASRGVKVKDEPKEN